MFQATQAKPVPRPDSDGYWEELDRRLLRAVAAAPGASLAEISRRAGGAFPSVVAERASLHGHALGGGPGSGHEGSEALPGPELHAAEFEWYFTDGCARELAALLRSRRGKPLLLGAPTVASAMARSGVRATAVDRSPFLGARFGSALGDLHHVDLRAPLGFLRAHSVIFFDAPWHADHIGRWLWQASLAVRRGGTVAFALFGPMTRPAARAEREQLLVAAEAIGSVSLLESALEYRTPLFESEALAASGHEMRAPWRLGDLVLIENASGTLASPPAPHEQAWATRSVGDLVVKARPGTQRQDPSHWNSLPALDTVSRSRTRHLPIVAWTSRNRVALPSTARREVSSTTLPTGI